MEQRVLGRTGRLVSVLGLGGHTYPVGEHGFATHDERAALVARLVAGGVSYFDTTWLNEVELLADSFRRAGLDSADYTVSLQYVDAVSDGQWRHRLRAEVEQRLAVLGWSRAPLFLMGIGNGRPPVGEIIAALEALAELRDQGLIGHLGLSCHEPARFAAVAEALERTDLADYLLLRYNPKFAQAAERLLPVAQAHGVGVVGMKVCCWDCGPDQWGRRISVFEPAADVDEGARAEAVAASLRWALRHPAVATIVPAMNATWEADANLAAVARLDEPVDETQWSPWRDRLWDRVSLAGLAVGAESAAIRERAAALLG